eukprot:scaffold48210_cov35-Phaeocystis_antarctica.AAC.3
MLLSCKKPTSGNRSVKLRAASFRARRGDAVFACLVREHRSTRGALRPQKAIVADAHAKQQPRQGQLDEMHEEHFAHRTCMGLGLPFPAIRAALERDEVCVDRTFQLAALLIEPFLLGRRPPRRLRRPPR